MKIAALSPQFVIEAPPGEETEDLARTNRRLRHLQVVQSQPSENVSPEGNREGLQQETKEGLKRLSRLIRQAAQEKDQGGKDQNQKRRRALALYKKVDSGQVPQLMRGLLLNKAS